MKPIEVHELAIREAGQALNWYAARSEGASERFTGRLRQAFSDIVENPERYPSHLFGTRRLRLHRFPYLVVYIEQPHSVLVLAIAHAKRRADYWRRRIP